MRVENAGGRAGEIRHQAEGRVARPALEDRAEAAAEKLVAPGGVVVVQKCPVVELVIAAQGEFVFLVGGGDFQSLLAQFDGSELRRRRRVFFFLHLLLALEQGKLFLKPGDTLIDRLGGC